MSIHALVGDSTSIPEIYNSPADKNNEVSTLNSHHHPVDIDNPSSELKQETVQHQTPPNIDTSQSTEALKEIMQAAQFGDLSRIKNIINSLPQQDFQMNSESSVNAVLLSKTSANEAGVDTVVDISLSQRTPTSNATAVEERKTGGNNVVKEQTGPTPSQPSSVAQLASLVPSSNSSIAQISQPMDLSRCTEVNLSVPIWNNAGDLLPISLSHPDYPPIVLQLKTDPPAPYGNTISLNFTTDWILKRLNDMMTLNPSLGTNGTPIIMPFSISTNRPDATSQLTSQQQQQQSLTLIPTVNAPPSKTIAIPVQAAQVETVNVTPTIIQQAPPLPQPPPIKPLPGTRKMRPIAPKPPVSSNTLSAGIAGLSLIRPSGSRNARKIVGSTQVTITTAASIAPTVTLIPTANSNSRGAGVVSSSNNSNNNSRNRNRRKNTTTTNVANSIPLIAVTTLSQMPNSIPVAITNNPPTGLIPQTGGYMMDSSGNIISADSTTVTGGFMQPVMNTGISNGTTAQIFTSAGQLLVNGPNGGLIPMTMLPPVEARSSEAEAGDIHQQNSYQTVLVHADGNSAEGYAQQVYFRSDNNATTNGTGTQQFIMTHQGYQTTNQEYQMQSFQTAGQPTEFIQSNGSGTFILDGSCYMHYYGGQVQPVESVEIRDAPGEEEEEEEEEDILDTAMRVAREGCSDNEVINLNQFAEDGASNAGSMMNDFMQQRSASNVNSGTEYTDQQQQQQSEDLPGSTGDAKIDALLAEAALVSSVNGVGDNQSAVSVPVPSLLGTRVGNAEITATETTLDATAVTDNNTNDEFPQALYDSFANFNSTVMRENLPTTADMNPFNYMSEEVNLDADFCGTTTVDLDASSSQNDADSFIKNLANQVDEMSAEFSAAAAAKGEFQNHNSPERTQPAMENVSFVEQADGDAVVSNFGETEDDHQETSHHHVDDDMEDFLRAVDDDVNNIFLNRDYDVDGFGLLDPSSSLRVPDDLTEHNAPEDGNAGSLHPVDDISINDSLLPPELTLQNVSVLESSPPPPVPATAVQNPPSPVKKALPNISDDDSDSSGSELDFLPSRANRKSNENILPPLSPVVSTTKSVEPQIQYSSSPLSSPQSTRKSPRRSPRQSTPRRKLDQRSSVSSGIPLSPLRRSTRRSNDSRQASEKSPTPVSPNLRRSLRSSAAATAVKRMGADDDLATALMLSDSESMEIPSSDAAINPDATFETEPLTAEDQSIRQNQESNQLESSTRTAEEHSFSSPFTDSPYRQPWFLGSERPKSFGLTDTPEISTSVPVNNIPEIGMELELRDNPVLQSGIPFWGNVASTDSTNTTEGEDEDDNCGEQLRGRQPQDSVGSTTDDSDAESILSLQAAVRAGSFALNVNFNSPLTLPHDDNTFFRFAASASLQSFDTLAVVPPSTSKSHSSPLSSPLDCTNNSPADSDQAAIPSPDSEESSEGTITPNSCIPDPANLSFSESLFPPKFPSPSKISTNPLQLLQTSASSLSFSAIAEISANPPKMVEETQTSSSLEQTMVIEENMNGDTEHLPVQSVIVPSTSFVSPVASMVATTTGGSGRSMVADDSAPAVEIIDLSPTPPSPPKEPLKMKISLSSIRSHNHRHHKEKKEKDKKNKKKEIDQAVTNFKRIRSIEETATAGPNCEPTPPKVGKLIISRVGDSYQRQPTASNNNNDGCESFHSVVGSNHESLPPKPLVTMKPLNLISKPKRGRGRPATTKRTAAGTRGRPRGSRGIGRGVVQVGATRTDGVPRPQQQQQWSSASPFPVDQHRTSSPEEETIEEIMQPTEPPSNGGRKFFSSSKEDRRSSAITKNRSWRAPYGTTVRKRGRYSGSLFTRDRRNSQSQPIQRQSISTIPSTAILLPSTTTLPPTEPLRVRVHMSTNGSSSGQPSGNSQTGASEQLQATEGSTILTTSNPDEEHYQSEVVNLETQSRPQSQCDGGAVFFVAPEAEIFVDQNHAHVKVVVNRAACFVNGIDPGLSDDDDDDSEDDGNNAGDNDRGGDGNMRRVSPNEPPPPHRPPSSNPPRSHGSVEQHQRSSYRSDQPQNYSSSQAPSFNHQPAATPVFTPTRCDMTVSSAAAAMHQQVPPPTATTTRTSGDAQGSARSSSTASGSLPAPSTISPAPFAIPQANNEVATENHNEPNLYQSQQQQMSSGRQFAETRQSPFSQTPSTLQQQRSQEAFAAAYAAMFANPYLLIPPYGSCGQREQQSSRGGPLIVHSNTLHHQNSSAQQGEHQRFASSYRGEDSSTNEAHQNHHSYSLTPNFTNPISERGALNYYAWNAHQYHQPSSMSNPERNSYPTSSSSLHNQNSSSVNHSGATSMAAASQWYQGVAHSSGQPGVVTQSPPNSTSNYPQLDDPVVAAAVAARYRLSPFPKLS